MPAHCPSLRVAGAGQTAVVARSSHAAPGIARRWRLASPALRDSKVRTYFSTAQNETTDKHRAAKPQPKKSHHEDTKKILCDFFASSRLRVFVVNRMRALPGGRTKALFQVAKNFQYRVVQVRVRLCSSVVSFMLLRAVRWYVFQLGSLGILSAWT